MKTVEMRRVLLSYYQGSGFWVRKVNAMPDNQIIAFYSRLKRAGKV